MKVLLITLISHLPDPITGHRTSTTRRFREVVDAAVLAEELGFDGYGVGERHERPFISSAPPVVLSHIAAKTSSIRLFTAVTTLSLLDPVRAYEDYATLDHLCAGRLELIIGKGNGSAQAQLFHVTAEDQWDRNREGYELFRRLWREEKVTWSGRYRPPLVDAETWPRPLQQPIRVWHGSATSRESVDLAARYGDPIFSANVTNPIEPYAELIDYYRERWAHHGHDPADALVGAGTAGFYAARTSQEAVATYRPIFEARAAAFRRLGVQPVFATLEDAIERSSILVGSPAQIVDKVLRYHQRFGHEVMHLSADSHGLTDKQQRASLELFQAEVAPVLRREVPSRPFRSPAATPA
jgi:alkanesulfonate monooxygenase SsuD/methylene tetrahydromethanopterin reductase-like flavin-dependent oxidoreductase (luciferase family)